MATISKSAIANLALSNIKDKGTISNLDTDQSAQGKIARLWYDVARRQALVDYNGGFALKRQALATHGEDPSADWSFRFQFPATGLHPRFVQNPLGRDKAPIPFDWEVADDGTQSILTDQEDAILAFTFDQEDTTFFTPHFVLSLSFLLGHYIAGPLSKSQNIQDRMLEKYNTAINVGMAAEANVTSIGTDEAPLASWTQER